MSSSAMARLMPRKQAWASTSVDRPSSAGTFTPQILTLGTGGGSPITTLHISHIGCRRRRSAALLASSRESRKRQGDPLSNGDLATTVAGKSNQVGQGAEAP